MDAKPAIILSADSKTHSDGFEKKGTSTIPLISMTIWGMTYPLFLYVFANHISYEGPVSRLYKECLQVNNKKANNPILKMVYPFLNGRAPGWLSRFGSGHDLIAREFEHRALC